MIRIFYYVERIVKERKDRFTLRPIYIEGNRNNIRKTRPKKDPGMFCIRVTKLLLSIFWISGGNIIVGEFAQLRIEKVEDENVPETKSSSYSRSFGLLNKRILRYIYGCKLQQ